MKEIKLYKEVEIGDVACHHPDSGGWENCDPIGDVVWKGTLEDLKQSKYKNLLVEDDWGGEVEGYNLLIVYTTGWDASNVIFHYDGDPSSCVVFKS